MSDNGITPDLSPFEAWMVKQNVEHAQTEGIDSVVARLEGNGYHRVAAAVRADTNNLKS